MPRTRGFATGFDIGLSALWFATKISYLRIPKPNPLLTSLEQWCLFAAEALALPTLICLLWFARSQAKAAGSQPTASTTRRFRARRVSVLILGLVGAATRITGPMLREAKGFNSPGAFVFTQSAIAGTWFGVVGFVLLVIAFALLAAASRAKPRAVTEQESSNSV